MKTTLTMLAWLMLSLMTHGQTYQFEMVANLNPSSGSNPRWFTVWDSTMYFFANEPIHGFKMYSIQHGGQPILCPNLGVGGVYGDGTISTSKSMGLLNGKLYLPASIAPNGRELYSYDGVNTPNLVMDINPGTGSGSPFYMMSYNSKLYFQANNGVLGSELWSHDPITNMTQCLTDINPGANPSTIAFITAYNNKLYFAGTNGNDTTAGNTGIELYSYDPANNTTSLVMDINPGYLPSNPFGLTVINNKLYFVASETMYGKELYEYDGNTVTRLTDVNPGSAQGVYTSDHSYPTYFNGSIYFATNDASNLINLGKYDLNTNTTSILYCSGNTVSGNPRYFKVFDGRLFFTNLDTTNGYELWSYDGINPPSLTADIRPGSASGLPIFMEIFDDELYFNAMNDTSSSEELFRLKRKTNEEPAILHDETAIQQFTLFPNPTQGVTHLNFTRSQANQEIYVEVTSMSGVSVWKEKIGQTTTSEVHLSLDLTEKAKGIYLLTLRSKHNVLLKQAKLIKW